MKKTIASIVFIVAFSAYALSQRVNSIDVQNPVKTATAQSAQDLAVAAAASSPPENPAPQPARAPAPKPSGQYKDGVYTGSSVNAYYGYVQVKVTVAGGKISDVAFLDYPRDRGTSREINSQAMPMLKQEAVSVQNANVDGVSGATDTSAAFQRSLASALSQAKA
jgi:uncharacterized protein with FMN-binding domain